MNSNTVIGVVDGFRYILEDSQEVFHGQLLHSMSDSASGHLHQFWALEKASRYLFSVDLKFIIGMPKHWRMAYQHIQGMGSRSVSVTGSQFGDTTLTKVFVGGLAWETQSDTMRRYFEQFGEILEAVVITDKNTGRSKGYGFLMVFVVDCHGGTKELSVMVDQFGFYWADIAPPKVTFRDPEAARRACADPSPIIDGRRANCNLASLGRPRPSPPYGRWQFSSVVLGACAQEAPIWEVIKAGRHILEAQLITILFHMPISKFSSMWFEYGSYAAYATEYGYPQNIYNPYLGAQYPQIYGSPGTVNPAVYPYAHIGQPFQTGHGYPALHGYGVPGPHLLQFAAPGVNAVTTISQQYGAAMPAVQGPFPSAVAAPGPTHPQFIVPSQSQQQFTQGGSGSEQPSGIPSDHSRTKSSSTAT
eukprot:Gb_26520 [translate_table: standard]